MQDYSGHGPNGQSSSVYIIIRVFGLRDGFVGFQIFVDPESKRQRGELDFTAESWRVAVVRGRSN